MNRIKVILWDKEIGRLVWEPTTRRSYFMFNPAEIDSIPDVSPLLCPKSKTKFLLPIYGDDRPAYQSLPPFLADSLPDSWGSTLFDKWVSANKVPSSKITPLYKLMFIGKRGMGAFEFEPEAADLEHTQSIDVKALYDLSRLVLEQRENALTAPGSELTKQALLAVGTSAGGRQMKAIIAINDSTGEIRSGQIHNMEGFDYFIIKFGSDNIPSAEIEMAYYAMAKDAGIDMEECRLMNVEGTNHFLTKRFDRKKGRKIISQTLAAIWPEARNYEDLFAVARELQLSENELIDLYRRLVFNVIANNTDDHNKNFSFLLDRNSKWRLAPAYDITFTFNVYGTDANTARRFSISGKVSNINKTDLLVFAENNGINDAEAIIDRIASVIGNFREYAETYMISRPWCDIIENVLNHNLHALGYVQASDETDDILNISITSKGYYMVTANVDGFRKKRVIRPTSQEYAILQSVNVFQLSQAQKKSLIGTLFNK